MPESTDHSDTLTASKPLEMSNETVFAPAAFEIAHHHEILCLPPIVWSVPIGVHVFVSVSVGSVSGLPLSDSWQTTSSDPAFTFPG